MKFLSAAFVLLLTSVSGVALAADGQPMGTNSIDNQVFSAKFDQDKADDKSAGTIHCACTVPMTFA